MYYLCRYMQVRISGHLEIMHSPLVHVVKGSMSGFVAYFTYIGAYLHPTCVCISLHTRGHVCRYQVLLVLQCCYRVRYSSLVMGYGGCTTYRIHNSRTTCTYDSACDLHTYMLIMYHQEFTKSAFLCWCTYYMQVCMYLKYLVHVCRCGNEDLTCMTQSQEGLYVHEHDGWGFSRFYGRI